MIKLHFYFYLEMIFISIAMMCVWLQFPQNVSVIDAGTICALHSSSLVFSTQDRESGDFAGIEYWNFSSGETDSLHVKSVNGPKYLKISPDGRHMLLSSTNEMEIFGLEPGRRSSQVYIEDTPLSDTTHWLDNSRLICTQACGGGTMVMSDQLVSTLSVWDLGAMSYEPIEIATVKGGLSQQTVLAVNGSVVVTGDSMIRDATLSTYSSLQMNLWDVRTGATIRSLCVPHVKYPDPEPGDYSWPVCCLDADNRTVVVHFHGQLHVFDIGTGLITRTINGFYKSMRTSFAANQAGTAAVGRGGRSEGEGMVLWDLARRQSKLALDNPFGQNQKFCGMAASPDLNTVAILAKDPQGIVSSHIWSS